MGCHDVNLAEIQFISGRVSLTILLKPGEFLRQFLISISERFSSSWEVRMWFSLVVSSCMQPPKCSIVFNPSRKQLKKEKGFQVFFTPSKKTKNNRLKRLFNRYKYTAQQLYLLVSIKDKTLTEMHVMSDQKTYGCHIWHSLVFNCFTDHIEGKFFPPKNS